MERALISTARQQEYRFSAQYTLLAEAAGISLRNLFWDAESIVFAYRRANDDLFSPVLRDILASQFETPRLPYFNYCHVGALGAEIEIPEDGEPKPKPLIGSPDQVSTLKDPPDFVDTDIVLRRRELAEEVSRLWGGDITVRSGAIAEGPVTTAVLLAGQECLTWPYDYPRQMHELLRFCTESAAAFKKRICEYEGGVWPMEVAAVADDFAGMFSPATFDEFVVPCLQHYYELLGCKKRILHSELLRVDHLHHLSELRIDHFDPGADQFLTPEVLQEYCPVPFQLNILASHLRDLGTGELEELYNYLASFEPALIEFCIEHPFEEDNFLEVLNAARRLNGEARIHLGKCGN